MSRRSQDLPLFTWTVRTPRQRARAAKWADAPIFEGYEA
jgi:glycerophosphoryl diester phosphodiesterase